MHRAKALGLNTIQVTTTDQHHSPSQISHRTLRCSARDVSLLKAMSQAMAAVQVAMYVLSSDALLQTYVPWNLHEPSPGVYNWEGTADLTGYLDVAARLGLNVLLRAGPYICGEWDFGGLPWWLAYPAVRLYSPKNSRAREASQHALLRPAS